MMQNFSSQTPLLEQEASHCCGIVLGPSSKNATSWKESRVDQVLDRLALLERALHGKQLAKWNAMEEARRDMRRCINAHDEQGARAYQRALLRHKQERATLLSKKDNLAVVQEQLRSACDNVAIAQSLNASSLSLNALLQIMPGDVDHIMATLEIHFDQVQDDSDALRYKNDSLEEEHSEEFDALIRERDEKEALQTVLQMPDAPKKLLQRESLPEARNTKEKILL
jgi:hypothetical protein